jgi:subtilisin family serine protease
VAAGNSRVNVSNSSPARAANAITIAALSDSDGKPGKLGSKTSYGADDTFATYSNYGAGVDFICPGTSITATWPGNKYAKLSGTSMAAPHMAGFLSILFDPNTKVTNGTTSEPLPTGPSGLAAYISKLGTETVRGPDFRNYLLPQPFVKQTAE